jgi:hypothetical protein
VKLVAFPDNEESQLAMINLAEELESGLPGTSEYPSKFNIFSPENVIPATNQYLAESFLGMQFMNQVYSQEYLVNSDTLKMFISADSTGEKYLKYSEYIKNIGNTESAPDDIGLNPDYSFMYEDNFYGTVLIGLVNRNLVGVINYRPAHKKFVHEWLINLK